MWNFYAIIFLTLASFGNSDILIFDGGVIVDEFADVELEFSKPVGRYGIEGVIVSANPLDACSEISKPPNSNYSENWIVLIDGSYCDYHTKVMYADLAGYSAAVIYNYRTKEEVIYDHHLDVIFNISAVTVRASSGIMIRENYLYTVDKRFRIVLAPSPLYSKRLVFTARYLMLLTTAVFLIFFFAVPFGIVKYVQHSHSYREARLSSQHLRQLQVSTYQKGGPYETCAICLEDYKMKDKLRILPCAHGYHVKCIDPWLTKSKRICPICKQKVVVSGDLSREDAESDVESRAESTPLLRNVEPMQTTSYQTMPSPRSAQPSCSVGTMTQDISDSSRENSL
ncbi:E3 ubiquitin-protein ligase RNF13-like isoform X2 [Argiope bruennichi]|uniref:E3 ubiquitin-protein ligase RNF13 like protein n=1 Tax=Argiope bruennichi TaxID=94029 RepID=A0A8T0F3V2_ARGBR|nr:E3 ubiquitin-protein ligase RNF13-like isoform X2 [Argiope bruennichi]KAF8784965.1 E3 ubiquitin-protein ligase RNF13 like protein [Argiope bruennichi]